jgi:lysophospholipid hydrolase
MIDLLHVAQHASPFALGDEDSSVNGTTPDSLMDGKNANLLEDLGNEVEILYFPAGSVLVQAGETQAGESAVVLVGILHNLILFTASGLYYVIDGFLDVSSGVLFC